MDHSEDQYLRKFFLTTPQHYFTWGDLLMQAIWKFLFIKVPAGDTNETVNLTL